jgi:hypothetical protein
MIRKILATVAAAILGTGLAVTAAPGAAQAAWAWCPTNYFCIANGPDGTGTNTFYQASYVQNIPSGCHSWTNGVFNNDTESWWNRTPYTIRMFDGGDCWTTTTFNRALSPGQRATAQGSDWGNRFSSFYRVV